jgi:hypothetical protein
MRRNSPLGRRPAAGAVVAGVVVIATPENRNRIHAPFPAHVRRGRHSDFCEFPGEFRERLDASSTSNVLTTPKTLEFSGIFPDNSEADNAI